VKNKMYIKNSHPAFYGFEKLEFHKCDAEIQNNTILVLHYLQTERSRTKKLQAFFLDDLVSTDSVEIVGTLAQLDIPITYTKGD